MLPIERPNVFIGVASGAIAIFLIYRSVISVCELIMVSDNRKKKNATNPGAVSSKLKKSKDVDVGSIMELVKECDVIEFEAIVAGRSLFFGASSDFGRQGAFFDKVLYIEEKTYKSVEEYEKALRDIAFDGKLKIYRIDGVSVDSCPRLKKSG